MAALGVGGPNSGFATPGPLEREALTLVAVRIAVELGVGVGAQNVNGRTAVQAAQRRGYDSVVEFLRNLPIDGGAAR